ncbi:MAG: 30S ribosomal protein S20 [Planctomycetaceae bacterium]|nr:30S ribosomal protein S20 [Planctomycetaceae bacterium]
MPNTKSAEKRVRQTKKRNALNNWRKRRVKDAIKGFLAAVATGDAASAEKAYRDAASAVDRTASTSTMHRNTAARRKSLMARKLKAMQGGGAAATKPAKGSAKGGRAKAS